MNLREFCRDMTVSYERYDSVSYGRVLFFEMIGQRLLVVNGVYVCVYAPCMCVSGVVDMV